MNEERNNANGIEKKQKILQLIHTMIVHTQKDTVHYRTQCTLKLYDKKS